MNMILIGPPGAGKGTLAAHVAAAWDIAHISTGEMLRAAVKRGGTAAEQAGRLMRKGLLLPDALILRIVQERLSQHDCAEGFILDGMPRTVAQAQALEAMGVSIDKAILLMVADDVVIRRMTARRICAGCGAGYNLDSMPPKKEGLCDICHEPIIARADDSPETIANRLKLYHHEAEPVIDFYRHRKMLLPIIADSTPQETAAAWHAALAAEHAADRMPH
ncbi:MAG: adenylate kinase family protein [Candidatus Fimivivens sp.]